MKTDLMFLEVSKNDLEVANHLFEKGFYPQSIFYLQQAVEKATKAWGLHFGIISEDELKKIGHESSKVYLKILKKLRPRARRGYRILSRLPKVKRSKLVRKYEDISMEEFDAIMDNFEDYIKNPQDFVSEEELEGFISELNKIEKEVGKQKKIKKGEIKEFKQEVVDLVNTIAGEYSISSNSRRKVLEDLERWTPDLIKKYVDSFAIPIAVYGNYLLFLSLILCPHAVSSRYPDHENPLNIYTEEHPLIKRFNQLTAASDKTLKGVSALFSKDFSEKPVNFFERNR